jgi:hypothetical protein
VVCSKEIRRVKLIICVGASRYPRSVYFSVKNNSFKFLIIVAGIKHSLKILGSPDGALNPIKEVYEGERSIFQDFIKTSKNIGREIYQNSLVCKLESLDNKRYEVLRMVTFL